MDKKIKINCPACGRPNRPGKKFCTNCGSSMSDPAGAEKYSLKWILLSMLMIACFQIITLIMVFIVIYLRSGLDLLLENILFTGEIAIPVSIFIASFLCSYFFRKCTIADIISGTGAYLILLMIINLIRGSSAELSYIIFFIELLLLAFAGAWSAKKIRKWRDRTV